MPSIAQKVVFVIFLLASCIGALELLYRFQVVDCYRGELEQSTKAADLDDAQGQKTLLVLGDSFAAGPATFASDLESALDGDWRTVNSAISGSGVVQARIISKARFKRFRPSLFLYQIYVGNDLFDYRYPSAWGRVSYARSLYWTVSRSLRSVAWINYKVGQLRYGIKHAKNRTTGPKPVYQPQSDVFSAEKFTARDRIYALAEPTYVADSVLLRGRLGGVFEGYLNEIDRLFARCRQDDCRVVVLVIPHFSQLGGEAADRARRIGLQITEEPEFFALDYPFFVRLQEHIKRSRPNVLMINPLEEFRVREATGGPLYFQNDSHLNPDGQKYLAEIVRARIDDLGNDD